VGAGERPVAPPLDALAPWLQENKLSLSVSFEKHEYVALVFGGGVESKASAPALEDAVLAACEGVFRGEA